MLKIAQKQIGLCIRELPNGSDWLMTHPIRIVEHRSGKNTKLKEMCQFAPKPQSKRVNIDQTAAKYR